jgi:hypothetical protein
MVRKMWMFAPGLVNAFQSQTSGGLDSAEARFGKM